MKRHERDDLSLVAGLACVLTAGAYLVGAAFDLEIGLTSHWLGPAVLLTLGVFGLLASARRLVTPARKSSQPEDAPPLTDRPRDHLRDRDDV